MPSTTASLALPLVLVLASAARLAAQDEPTDAGWRAPTAATIRAPARTDAPILACTPAGLERLRAAFRGGSRPVVAVVESARRALGDELAFPPRGGQHNQWYQCDACQRALVTVDATHHRCDGCGEVYTGPPYDDVVFSRVHGRLVRRARTAAWAYALTGEAAFADDARAVLLGYAARYREYPYHSNAKDPTRYRDSGGHIKEQTLSEASMLVRDLAPACDLVWPALRDDERTRILDGLIRPMVENIAKCRRGRSNWQSWHNAAMFSGGVLLGDADWMRRSILDPRDGFLHQMQISVSPDGMWYENSFGYHNYTLSALCHHADAARVAGIDLFGHPVLRRMCALPARYLMADGTLPRIGDDVSSSPLGARTALEAAYAATGDVRLRAVLPATPSFESIRHGRVTDGGAAAADDAASALGSEVLRATGHAILRRGGPAGMSAFTTFAPFGGFHDHFDRLSFTWYAFGTERGVDPGRARSQAYRLPIHRNWYRATLAHDTVVVDGRSQEGTGGTLLGFVADERFAAVAARLEGAFPGVVHERCLILTDEYLVVLDRLDGTDDEEHTFDWVYHDRSPEVRTGAVQAGTPEPLGIHGEDYVAWSAEGWAPGPVDAVFVGDPADVTTRLQVAASEGSPYLVRTGNGPVASVDDRAAMLLVRRRGRSATFAAVLSAARGGGADGDRTPFGIEAVDEGGVLAVEVTRATAGAAETARRDRFRWREGTVTVE